MNQIGQIPSQPGETEPIAMEQGVWPDDSQEAPLVEAPTLAAATDPPAEISIEPDFDDPEAVTTDSQATEALHAAGERSELSLLDIYFDQIHKTPLLSPQEEIDLAKRIEKGDLAAKEHLTEANLRLVVHVAKRYRGYGVPLLDLIQNGSLGLIRATEKFDYRKGKRFATYAIWHIMSGITRQTENNLSDIRVPGSAQDKLRKIRRTTNSMQAELGREPTLTEVGEELGMTTKGITELITSTRTVISLDSPIAGREGSSLSDITVSNTDISKEVVEQDAEKALQLALINALNINERLVINGLFEVFGSPKKEIKELAEELGITTERVRNIRDKALAKLEYDPNLSGLFD